MQFPAITSIKLSFLFFYKRIFSTPSTPMLRIILWTMIVICAAWGIIYFFTFVFVCGTHFSAMWSNPSIFKQHCSRIVKENYWLAITDFVLDAIIFIIPLPLVSKSKMSFKTGLKYSDLKIKTLPNAKTCPPNNLLRWRSVSPLPLPALSYPSIHTNSPTAPSPPQSPAW